MCAGTQIKYTGWFSEMFEMFFDNCLSNVRSRLAWTVPQTDFNGRSIINKVVYRSARWNHGEHHIGSNIGCKIWETFWKSKLLGTKRWNYLRSTLAKWRSKWCLSGLFPIAMMAALAEYHNILHTINSFSRSKEGQSRIFFCLCRIFCTSSTEYSVKI